MATHANSTPAPAFENDVVGLYAARKAGEPDPGYALIRAVPPNAATFVHNAIMDMLAGRLPTAPSKRAG